MTTPEQHAERPPVRWSRLLLVLGVLAGLMAMHALAPGGGLHEGAHGGMPRASVTAGVYDGCSCGDCGGGHLQHADPTCKAAAVSGGPALPALVPDPGPVTVRAQAVRPYPAPTPDGGRAPPSLAELQLLRI